MTGVAAAVPWNSIGGAGFLGHLDQEGWTGGIGDAGAMLDAHAKGPVASAMDWKWQSFAAGQSLGHDPMQDARKPLDLLSAGVASTWHGEGAMRVWTRGMLGTRGGSPKDFVVNLDEEAAAPFSRGLEKRWNVLTRDVMKLMPGQVRQQFEGVLNSEMSSALDVAMLYDDAVDEYHAMSVQRFDAGGGNGGRIEASLTDAKRQWAKGTPAADGKPAQPGLELDLAPIRSYLQAKGQAAMAYAERYDADLRPGIVAVLMGPQFSQRWLLGELGWVAGQGFTPDNAAKHPHADAVVGRWNEVTAHKLDRMPEHLRGRFEKVANPTFAQAIREAMLEDKKIGKYGDVRAHLWANGGDRPDYKFWLKDDNSLGYEQIVHHDCISDIILPIVGAVLTIIPGTQAIGIAMTTALAVKNGVETGNWLGAAASVVGGAIGLGGLGAFGALGSGVASGLQTASTVMRVGMGAYGMAKGIVDGDIYGAIGGGLGMAGGALGAAGVGSNSPWTYGLKAAGAGLGIAKGADKGDLYGALGGATSLAGAGAQLAGMSADSPWAMGLSAANAGLSIARGVDTDNPFDIAGGALSLASGGTRFAMASAFKDAKDAAGAIDAGRFWGVSGNELKNSADLSQAVDDYKFAAGVKDVVNHLDGALGLAGTAYAFANGKRGQLDGFGLATNLMQAGVHGYSLTPARDPTAGQQASLLDPSTWNDWGNAHLGDMMKGLQVGSLAYSSLSQGLSYELFGRPQVR